MKRWTEAPHRALAVLCRGGAAVLTAFIVVACGGGDGPPEQTVAPRDSMVGTAASGDTTPDAGNAFYSFSAKGTAGTLRTTAGQRGVADYEVSLVQLTGPYALSSQITIGNNNALPFYTVTPARGIANITPLTTLLVAQLFGEEPSTVYGSFGSGGVIDASRITDANLQAAQSRIVAFVKDETGFTIPATVGNFVTTPFRAVAGDPAYDAITGLVAQLAASNSSLQALTTTLVATLRQCQQEKIAVTVGGAVVDFCPQSKTATPRDADPTLIDYRFVDRRNNRLELAIRGDSVASVTYTTAASASFTCSGAGCAGVTLGTPAGDLTRTITFARLALQGATGSAVLDGTLRGAIPGIALPILPCGNNRFIMVFADRSTVGRCTDPDPGLSGFPGVTNSNIGVAPTRAGYGFVPFVDTDPTSASISIVTDENNSVLAIQFTDADPDTLTIRRRYVCKDAACLGAITYGASTVEDTVFGPSSPYLVRTLTFADATLARVDEAGVPTGEVATLKSASFTTSYFPIDPPIAFPEPAACDPSLQTVAFASGTTSSNTCVGPGILNLPADNGDVVLQTDFSSSNSVAITINNDVVTRASLVFESVPGEFVCSGTCAGIAVSPPDGSGVRTVTISNAVLSEVFFGPVLGPRTLTFDGTLTFTPSP